MLVKRNRRVLKTVGAAFASIGFTTHAQAIDVTLGALPHVNQPSAELKALEAIVGQSVELSDQQSFASFSCTGFQSQPNNTSQLQSPVLMAQALPSEGDFWGDTPEDDAFQNTCGLLQGGIGGGAVSTFNPLLLSPLGALGLLLDGSPSSLMDADDPSIDRLASVVRNSSTIFSLNGTDAVSSSAASIVDPSGIQKVPEPMTILGTGVALGIGFLLERKRHHNS